MYNIGVLTVNIEFMWRGLETWKDELQHKSHDSHLTASAQVIHCTSS